jgi:uncharacterized protein YgiM (DUF1202 family)
MNRVTTMVLTSIAVTLAALMAVAAGQALRSVQVKEGHVRSGPSFLSTVIARLSYGDQVQAISEEGGWVKVGITGKVSEGWMHNSALSEKQIVLKSGAQNVNQAASGDEIALAGKGFNADVEKEFKSKRKDVNYAFIDQMEKEVVPQAWVQEFVKAGALVPEGGAK